MTLQTIKEYTGAQPRTSFEILIGKCELSMYKWTDWMKNQIGNTAYFFSSLESIVVNPI